MSRRPLQLAAPSTEAGPESFTPTVEAGVFPAPDDDAKCMTESLNRISQARANVMKKQFAWEEAKAATKLCKEDFDGAVAHLLDLIKSETQALPLFDRKPGA